MSDEPRWLDASEREAWLGLIGVLTRVPQELDRQLRRDMGMSHFEYQVLAMLSDAPDRTLRVSDLAALAEGSLPRVSQVVSKLCDRDWVERSRDPTDGRTTLATLTPRGWDAVVAAAPGHVERVRQLVFDPLSTAQVSQLSRICARIGAALDKTADG